MSTHDVSRLTPPTDDGQIILPGKDRSSLYQTITGYEFTFRSNKDNSHNTFNQNGFISTTSFRRPSVGSIGSTFDFFDQETPRESISINLIDNDQYFRNFDEVSKEGSEDVNQIGLNSSKENMNKEDTLKKKHQSFPSESTKNKTGVLAFEFTRESKDGYAHGEFVDIAEDDVLCKLETDEATPTAYPLRIIPRHESDSEASSVSKSAITTSCESVASSYSSSESEKTVITKENKNESTRNSYDGTPVLSLSSDQRVPSHKVTHHMEINKGSMGLVKTNEFDVHSFFDNVCAVPWTENKPAKTVSTVSRVCSKQLNLTFQRKTDATFSTPVKSTMLPYQGSDKWDGNKNDSIDKTQIDEEAPMSCAEFHQLLASRVYEDQLLHQEDSEEPAPTSSQFDKTPPHTWRKNNQKGDDKISVYEDNSMTRCSDSFESLTTSSETHSESIEKIDSISLKDNESYSYEDDFEEDTTSENKSKNTRSSSSGQVKPVAKKVYTTCKRIPSNDQHTKNGRKSSPRYQTTSTKTSKAFIKRQNRIPAKQIADRNPRPVIKNMMKTIDKKVNDRKTANRTCSANVPSNSQLKDNSKPRNKKPPTSVSANEIPPGEKLPKIKSHVKSNAYWQDGKLHINITTTNCNIYPSVLKQNNEALPVDVNIKIIHEEGRPSKRQQSNRRHGLLPPGTMNYKPKNNKNRPRTPPDIEVISNRAQGPNFVTDFDSGEPNRITLTSRNRRGRYFHGDLQRQAKD